MQRNFGVNMIKAVCVFTAFFFFGITVPGISATGHWSHHNEDAWPKQCHEGTSQSPIPLSTSLAEISSYPPFEFEQYNQKAPARLTNNGHTVEVRTQNQARIRGGGLPDTYVFDSMHFHWDSEHTVDSVRFPLELHMVHYSAKYPSLKHALNYPNSVAVLGIFFYVSPDNSVEIEPLTELLSYIRNRNGTVALQIALNDYLPRDKAGFYRYYGSLTTPDCTESVIWTLFTDVIPISHHQLTKFTMLESGDNGLMQRNYRSLQEINGRRILMKLSAAPGAAMRISVTTSLVAGLMLVYHSLTY